VTSRLYKVNVITEKQGKNYKISEEPAE
jgi:hypothetical protein